MAYGIRQIIKVEYIIISYNGKKYRSEIKYYHLSLEYWYLSNIKLKKITTNLPKKLKKSITFKSLVY